MTKKKPKGDIFGKSKQLLQKGTASTKKWYVETGKPGAIKAGGKLARHYKRYVRPTTKIVRGVGRFARGAGKLALRFPGTGLAATAAYYGAKHVIKKGERVAARSATKQWHKRDKFGKTRWYL
jgi:hypothetical protein